MFENRFVYLKRASISFGGLNSRAGFVSSSSALPSSTSATTGNSGGSGAGGLSAKSSGLSGGGVNASHPTLNPSSTPANVSESQTLGGITAHAAGSGPSSSMSYSSSSSSSSSNAGMKSHMPPPSLTVPTRVGVISSNPALASVSSITYTANAGAVEKENEDEDDFTLLLGMDEDDSSGDEEVLEEG